MRTERSTKEVKVFEIVVSITKNTDRHDLTFSLLKKRFKTQIPTDVAIGVSSGFRHVNIYIFLFFTNLSLITI